MRYSTVIVSALLLLHLSCNRHCTIAIDNTIVLNQEQLTFLTSYFDCTQKILVKNIVWNSEHKIGLIDASINSSHHRDYYPFLVSRDEMVALYEHKPEKDITAQDDSVAITKFAEFKNLNSSVFTAAQFTIMKDRLSKRVIQFGSALHMGDLDVVQDSVLLQKYLTRNDTIITTKCGRNR